MAEVERQFPVTSKKPSYPVNDSLRDYLRRYKRDRELPISYDGAGRLRLGD